MENTSTYFLTENNKTNINNETSKDILKVKDNTLETSLR